VRLNTSKDLSRISMQRMEVSDKFRSNKKVRRRKRSLNGKKCSMEILMQTLRTYIMSNSVFGRYISSEVRPITMSKRIENFALQTIRKPPTRFYLRE
jgi:hypothetical protein